MPIEVIAVYKDGTINKVTVPGASIETIEKVKKDLRNRKPLDRIIVRSHRDENYGEPIKTKLNS